jgi:hypothetical protein
MTGRTRTLSVHRLRRTARANERTVQAALRLRRLRTTWSPFEQPTITLWRGGPELPSWACGVRVEKAGRFQWSVIATEAEGH